MQQRESEELGLVIHNMIDAASVIAANFEIIAGHHPKGDEALLDDTRASVERLVTLARQAQRLRGSEPPRPAGTTG